MTYYEKDEIRAGIFLTKDGGQVSFPPRPKPRPPRYGDNFSAVSEQLNQVKARIEKLSADLRAAKQRR
jgi:hypothetical protein